MVVALVEIRSYIARPWQTNRVTQQLDSLVNVARVERGDKRDITTHAEIKYAWRVIKRLTARDPERNGQTKRTKTGDIKVMNDLSKIRVKNSDPRLG